MTMTKSGSGQSLAALVHDFARVAEDDRRYDAIVSALQLAKHVQAVVVAGIEHQAAGAIVRQALPAVAYRRRPLGKLIDEHLFVDVDGQTGARVLACWDARQLRVRMHVAEVGEYQLWDRIVALFTEWDMTGRPVPVE